MYFSSRSATTSPAQINELAGPAHSFVLLDHSSPSRSGPRKTCTESNGLGVGEPPAAVCFGSHGGKRSTRPVPGVCASVSVAALTKGKERSHTGKPFSLREAPIAPVYLSWSPKLHVCAESQIPLCCVTIASVCRDFQTLDLRFFPNQKEGRTRREKPKLCSSFSDLIHALRVSRV